MIDTPISEAAIIGAGLGAAITGLRPIVEIMFIDFTGVCMDQIANQVAKVRYMLGGQVSVPLVIRTQGGAGKSYAAQHSQSLEVWFAAIPGLKVVMPATPADAKGLLKSAIRSNDPVLFIEHKLLYGEKGPVPTDVRIPPAHRQGRGRPAGPRRDHRQLLAAIVDEPRRGASPGRRRDRLRGDRLADDQPAGHGHDPGVAGEDRTAGGG